MKSLRRSDSPIMADIDQMPLTSFIFETALYSLLVCVIPLLMSLDVSTMSAASGWELYLLTDHGSTYASPFQNVIFRANSPNMASLFYQGTLDLTDYPAWQATVDVCVGMSTLNFIMRYVDAVFMFQPSVKGLAVSGVFTLAIWVAAMKTVSTQINSYYMTGVDSELASKVSAPRTPRKRAHTRPLL